MRELFQRYDGGESVAQARRDLAKRGLKLSITRAHELLRNPFYAGFLVLADGTEIAGQWPALVTRDQFNRVRERLRRPRHERATRPYDAARGNVPAQGLRIVR